MLTGRLLGGVADIGWPSIRISPSVGVSKPATILSSVVLPQPEGPNKEKNSPREISKLAWSTAVTVPKRLLTFLNEIMDLSISDS